VLDTLMPGVDGLEVCRRLRAAGDTTPVLMLTVRDGMGDIVAGLDAGADDFVVKPFDLRELTARLRALIRRGNHEPEVLTFLDLRMDLGTREVFRGDRPIELTRTEFALLEVLLRHPRQVLTRSSLSLAVWDLDMGPTSDVLEVYVGYLRRKLESGGEPRLVHTARGVGYVLRESCPSPDGRPRGHRGGPRMPGGHGSRRLLARGPNSGHGSTTTSPTRPP
jgi:two-component system, OmpR family, response regulator MprA